MGAGILDRCPRIYLAPEDVQDLRAHGLAPLRPHKVDQEIDCLGDLLLLCGMGVGKVVPMLLKVFAEAGVDLIEKAHRQTLCSKGDCATLARNYSAVADAPSKPRVAIMYLRKVIW